VKGQLDRLQQQGWAFEETFCWLLFLFVQEELRLGMGPMALYKHSLFIILHQASLEATDHRRRRELRRVKKGQKRQKKVKDLGVKAALRTVF